MWQSTQKVHSESVATSLCDSNVKIYNVSFLSILVKDLSKNHDLHSKPDSHEELRSLNTRWLSFCRNLGRVWFCVVKTVGITCGIFRTDYSNLQLGLRLGFVFLLLYCRLLTKIGLCDYVAAQTHLIWKQISEFLTFHSQQLFCIHLSIIRVIR